MCLCFWCGLLYLILFHLSYEFILLLSLCVSLFCSTSFSLLLFFLCLSFCLLLFHLLTLVCSDLLDCWLYDLFRSEASLKSCLSSLSRVFNAHNEWTFAHCRWHIVFNFKTGMLQREREKILICLLLLLVCGWL